MPCTLLSTAEVKDDLTETGQCDGAEVGMQIETILHWRRQGKTTPVEEVTALLLLLVSTMW